MSNVDFKEHLRRQLRFLEASAAAYDKGLSDEAIRLAVVIRVLIHQTKSSTSLLKHLNATTINLLSTVDGADERAVLYLGMGNLRVFRDGRHIYSPSLENSPSHKLIPVSAWWDQVVFVKGNTRLSRRKIVLAAANQDGGAHVDESLNSDYKYLMSPGFSGIFISNAEGNSKQTPIAESHYVALRQMAFEILSSKELIEISL